MLTREQLSEASRLDRLGRDTWDESIKPILDGLSMYYDADERFAILEEWVHRLGKERNKAEEEVEYAKSDEGLRAAAMDDRFHTRQGA